MSKITFRADDDLVRAVESMDASKSEVMREALREYLDRNATDAEEVRHEGSLDDVVAERVDAIIDERLASDDRFGSRDVPDVNVNVSLDGRRAESGERVRVAERAGEPDTTESRERETSCAQCGETVDADHVYCPNCGEKASKRLFCECGDEIRADWAFCPGCGRRTPSAEVFER